MGCHIEASQTAGSSGEVCLGQNNPKQQYKVDRYRLPRNRSGGRQAIEHESGVLPGSGGLTPRAALAGV